MSDNSFLGTGMKFPPQANQATGRFVTVSELESVKESVYLILMTQRTERFVRPEFGSNLLSYTFMDQNLTNISMMCRDIARQIREQEPRVSKVHVEAAPDTGDGCLWVTVDYYVAAGNVRDNLVFPFYYE